MYRIIRTSDGAEIGMTEEPVYIRVTDAGNYAPCGQDMAVGVALAGTAYNLLGHSEIAEAETVILSPMDGGNYMAQRQSAVDERLTAMEDALCELDESLSG